jgi:carbonic anhydrase
VHVLLGGSSESSAWRNVVELPMQLISADHTGMLVGLLVIGILVAWRWCPHRSARSWARWSPSSPPARWR